MSGAFGGDGIADRGTPAQLMQIHLRNLLQRMRLTVPFEIDGIDLISACVPEGYWHDTTRWANVRLTSKLAKLTFFQTIADHKSSSIEGVFWYRYVEDLVPVPYEAMSALVIPEDAPFLSALNKWLARATDLNEAIMAASKLSTAYVGAMKHPENIRTAWPELWPFVVNVGSANKTFNKNVPNVPGHIAANARLDPEMRRKLIDMLVTATLLPDTQPVAWVGFHK